MPIEINYEQPPRGRVGYNQKRKTLLMLADACIIKNAALIKAVIAAFHLPLCWVPEPCSLA